jgi:hypothetical protein
MLVELEVESREVQGFEATLWSRWVLLRESKAQKW